MAITALQTEKWRQTIEAFLTTMTISTRILDRAIPIQGSDTFHVINPTDVSVTDVDDLDTITYEALTDTDVSITKNFDKAFSFEILDTNKIQTTVQGWERAYANNGSFQLANSLDASVFSNHAAWTDFQNSGSDWQFESDLGATRLAQVTQFFAGLRQQMRTNKVDNQGKPFLVVDPALGAIIEEFAANRQTNFGDMVLNQGLIRRFEFMGFNVYISNNLTTVSTTLHCMGGVESYGNAMGIYVLPNGVETLRGQGRFHDLVRGRVAAGHKVTRTVAVYDVMVNTTMTGT